MSGLYLDWLTANINPINQQTHLRLRRQTKKLLKQLSKEELGQGAMPKRCTARCLKGKSTKKLLPGD